MTLEEQIQKLIAERDRLIALIDKANSVGYGNAVTIQIERIQAERDAAKADLKAIGECVGGEPLAVRGLVESMDAAIKERDAALKACVYYLLTCDSLLSTILEDADLFNLFGKQTIIGILRTQESGRAIQAEAMQGVCLQIPEVETEQAGNKKEASGTLALTKSQEPKEISEIRQGLHSQTPREITGGLSKERSLQGEMSNGSEKCCCERKSKKAEDLSGMRLVGVSSRASQRLQQAIRGRVAMQHLSREEAQEILNAFCTDCSKGYHRDDEWKLVVKALERCIERLDNTHHSQTLKMAREALAHAERLTGKDK